MAAAMGYDLSERTVGDVAVVALLDALFANSQDALVTVDESGVITYATPAIAQLLGFDSLGMMGESVFEFLHPDDLEVASDLFTRRLELEGSDQGKQVRVRNSTGDWTSVFATAALLPDPRFGACAITLMNADDESNRELSLRRRIVVAEYVNRLGADLMAAPDAEAAVERIERALGEVGLLTGATSAALYIERRERESIEQLADWCASGPGDPCTIDLNRSDGSIQELLLERHIVVDALADLADDHRGRPLAGLLASSTDAGLLATPFSSGGQRGVLVLTRSAQGPGWWDSDSELVRGVANVVGRALQTTWSEELLALTYQLGPVGFSIRTFDGRFVDCNQRYLDLYGIDRSQVATTSLFDVLLPDYHDGVQELHRRLMAGELDRFVIEVEVRRGDGSTMWARANVVPMTVPGSAERYVLTALENITDVQQQRIELEHAASHDPLTGVANRSAMRRAIERHLATDRTLPGLLMIDLDDFKLVNDSYGHAAGDHVLQTVANRIANVLRGSDVVARLGGDEFAVVAPKLVAEGVDGLARRLRQAVDAPIEWQDETIVQTMSIGIVLGEDCVDLADLMVKADRALYAAKDNGRHCHVLFDPSVHADALS